MVDIIKNEIGKAGNRHGIVQNGKQRELWIFC